jgi:predicted nucleic acid-binding protein
VRIFLDANILFSAAASELGAVARLLILLRENGHECWVDKYVVMEAHRNLARKQPGALRRFAQLIEAMQIAAVSDSQARDLPKPAEILPDKDRLVLAAAIRCGSNALLTGDRAHFGRLYGQAISGVSIHSPASLAEALLK